MKAMSYKGVAFMLLLMVTSIPQPSSAGPFLMAAEGYVYGQLSNVRQERSINKVYVGEISLGHESSSNIGSAHLWQFCFEKNRFDDHDLYDFAINALKNTALVKVHYSDR